MYSDIESEHGTGLCGTITYSITSTAPSWLMLDSPNNKIVVTSLTDDNVNGVPEVDIEYAPGHTHTV